MTGLARRGLSYGLGNYLWVAEMCRRVERLDIGHRSRSFLGQGVMVEGHRSGDVEALTPSAVPGETLNETQRMCRPDLDRPAALPGYVASGSRLPMAIRRF